MTHALAILSVIVIPSWAMGEPKYEPKEIPKCEVKALKDGTKGCVYTLEQVKKLYEVDAALVAAKKKIPLLEQKNKLQGSVIEKTQKQLDLSLANTKLYYDRNKKLTEQLLKTDKELQYEKAKPRWGSYISWGVAIAVTAAFGGYVLADRLSE